MKKDKKRQKEWICEVCNKNHSFKKDLINCLTNHCENAHFRVDTAQNQLEKLGVDDPYL